MQESPFFYGRRHIEYGALIFSPTRPLSRVYKSVSVFSSSSIPQSFGFDITVQIRLPFGQTNMKERCTRDWVRGYNLLNFDITDAKPRSKSCYKQAMILYDYRLWKLTYKSSLSHGIHLSMCVMSQTNDSSFHLQFLI